MRFEIYNDFDICLFLTQCYIIALKDLEYSPMDYFYDTFRSLTAAGHYSLSMNAKEQRQHPA